MALKLFRTTGYSTLLMPGEQRQSLHPGWLVALVALWIGVACNAGLWRLAAAPETFRTVLATTLLMAGGSGAVLSLLGWRRTIRLAMTLMIACAALVACGLWVQDLPIETLWQQRPRTLLPPWPTFMAWQVPTLMLVLAVVPIVWVWNLPLRRLRGPEQLQANLSGAIVGAVLFAAGALLVP